MSEGCAKSGLLSSIAIILLLFLSGSAGVFCPIENVDANGTSCNYQVIPILVPIEETLLTTDDFVQGPAEIGQPVRWRRIFTPSRTSNSMEIELHANAFDIALNAPVNGTHFWLSPSSWSIERYASSPRGDKGIFRMIFNAGLPSGSTGEVEAEYYTEAPAINVTPLSHDKIAVRVSSQTHYQNILAYADVPDTQYREGGISLYLTTNGTFEQAQITNYSDTNGNGFIDRIYWIVPHLSEQTYEIVLISGAEHLDENRTFVEDAYEYVRTRGDNLSIQIPDGHYLRAAFERPLNSSADITIYASSNSSNASVAVYERNESTLLADFGTISQYGKYQVFLTLLNGTQDTFDLRVSGGEVVFDYVTDPPYNDTMMSLNPNFRWVLDGDFTDEMGNLDGTPGQAPDYVATIIPHSEHPQCGDFTPNDEMHVADDPLINTGSGYVGEVRSISVWFIADTIPTNDGNVIWGEGGGSNSLSVYTYDDGGTTKVYCAAVEGGNEDWVEYPITAGELYHLGCTYDFPNDEINMYLNGTLVDTDNSLSIGASLNSHGANNALGGQDGNTDNHLGTQMSDNFDGRIADFAYWSGGTVLSAENMSAIFNSGMYGSPSGEVEWNVSSLDLGTAYTSEPPTGAASITSNGTNSNATVSCVYGNCTKIADSWIDGTNMSDSQSFDVNFTCNSTTAGSFSALFNATSDEDATPSQINVSCTLMQPSVEWNMSELEIGTAEPDEGSLHGSANITSNGTNSNVALSCVYGNCTEITEDWLDTTDMHDGETFMVNFTCSNSSIGNFSAIFNLTSDWDASPEQVNVTCTIDYYPSIHIISAVHLDENRLFIEDVYEKVKTIDSLRARIPPTHYLRVVFDRELDASKDITIYAAHPPGPGTPYVDVYEEGGSTAIASFGEISQYGKYQTFLTLLNGTQDTFDLRVIGAQVGFDYVTDPPQWDYNFSKCKNITLTNVGTTNLTDFTIYVNVSYDSDMRSDYGDIRFVDSPCDSGGNPFNYEIEYTDANHADTWVRLDYLPPEGRIISMYYGNDSTASSQNPATAWNYTYTSIYHLNHTSGNAIDTMGNHSATEVVDPDSNMDVLGMFGRADYFDGSDYLDNNPKWSVTAPFAYEAWIRADTSSSDMIILEDGAQVQGAGIGVSSSGYFVFGGYYSSSYRSANSTAAVDDNQWHYVVGVNEPGYNMLAYVDGVLVANTSGIAGGLNPGSNGAAIAFVNNIDSTFPSGGTYFTGYLDEIRVSTNVLRTSDWINQTYLAVVNQSGIVAFGAEQARDGSGASVSWNVSSLDLGVGAQSGGPIAGSANITSSGTNSNITVSCDSGNCSTISEDWIDSTNMTDGQSFIANFSCSNSTAGNFSATFNLSSAQDTSIEQIVVNCTIVTPPGITINSPSGILADVTPALNITLDQAADTLWYNVDGGANSTICTSCGGEQATFLHLAEGSYTIHVYANNTVGQNYENSSFTVDMNGNYFDSFEDNSSVETYEGVTYNPGNISFEGSGSSPPDSWWDPSFSRCRNITVTNVGSSTLTNFPLYVNVTYDSDMKADYSDLRFVNTSCNNNGSALDFEIEYSNASHAATWVEIPSLPAGGTTISVYYGNSSASPAHNPSGVWDSNYAAIYHFNHTTGALADTKGAFNVPDGMSPDSNKDVMGVTGRADYFDGGDYFGPQSWDLDDTGTGFAYCAWVRFSSTSLMVVAEDGAYVSGAGIGMTGGNLRFGVSISSTHYPIDSTSTYNDDSWHYMCGVSTGTQTQLYVDGELDGQETRTAAIGTDAGGVGYGLGGSAGNAVSGDGSSNYYYTGYMDELWMSYTSRSADWINQTYQAIASQASIVSIGGEESSAGSSGGSGNFTSYSINTTGLIGSFLDITWNEVGTDSTNNISVKISVDNGNNYYAATNGSSLSGFTPGSAIIYRAIFTTDSAATIALTDMNITWASEAVSWNQSSLDLGTADPASGPLEGSANISSIGANNNVAVACDSGDCAIITEDWIDTIDMVDGQSFQANFTCSNSTEGVFSAVFNVTSDEDAEPDQINVSCTMDAPLAVSLISPPNASTDTDGNITFTCGATDGDGLENITLYGNWSGSSVEAYVDWLYNESIWRYNDSGVWPGTDWNGTAYDDSQWPEGPGTLGYDTAAASHLNTIISANGSVAYVSYYFRNNFSVTDASDVTQMNFTIDYDDGY
ncbi:DUF2341 domain-containing protein, partial [Candidatus Micrarchaeota archaeon]|nr:DUF2341 domain-containing protein [Candidatus Micrarchaeota archaeon]